MRVRPALFVWTGILLAHGVLARPPRHGEAPFDRPPALSLEFPRASRIDDGAFVVRTDARLGVVLTPSGPGTVVVRFSRSRVWGRIDLADVAEFAVPTEGAPVRFDLLVPRGLLGDGVVVEALLLAQTGDVAQPGAATLLFVDGRRTPPSEVFPEEFGFESAPAERYAIPGF